MNDQIDTFQSVGKVAAGVVAKLADRVGSIEKIPIAGRDEWLALRSRDVTASSAACLMGVHPYYTNYSLWLLKSGRIGEDPEETPAMKRGRLLEPVAVELMRELHPEWIIGDYPVGYYFRDPAHRIGCTPDLLARDQLGHRGVIQIKTVEPSVFRRTWRDDDGNIAPPLWVAVQAIIEASLTGSHWAAVAPMIVGFGLEMPVIPIPVHAGIFDRVKSEVAAFWRSVESGKAPDPDYGRDGALLERMFDPDATKVADLSQDNHLVELADERARLTAEKKAIDTRLPAIKAEMILKLGDAAAGRLADGRLIVSKKVNRKAYQVDASSYTQITVKEAMP